MKYERRLLSQPWRAAGRAAGRCSDHVGTAAPGCPAERSSARSFSGSAVVAILFKIPYLNFSRSEPSPERRETGQAPSLHTHLDADAERSHRLSHNVNRTGNDHQAARSGDLWFGNLAR